MILALLLFGSFCVQQKVALIQFDSEVFESFDCKMISKDEDVI